MAKYFVGLIFVATVAGCSIHLDGAEYTPEIRPRLVLDADTQQAVGGAYVIFNWWETRANLAGGQSHCVRAEFRTSDPQGRFEIPAWRGAYPAVADVYKPGMVFVGSKRTKEGVELVRKSEATGEARYREMMATLQRMGCEDGGQHLSAVYTELLQEATQLRSSSADQRYVDGIEFERDAAKYGFEEARRIRQEKILRNSRERQQ